MANFFGRNDDYMSGATRQDMAFASLVQSQQQTQQMLSQMLSEMAKMNENLVKIANMLSELKQQAPVPQAGGYAAGSYATQQYAQDAYDAGYQQAYDNSGQGYTEPYSPAQSAGYPQPPQPPAFDAQASAPQASAIATETFYANIDGNFLNECPEKYKQTALVVVTAQGDDAVVEFNPLCAETYASSFDTNLMPYFDTEVHSTNPTSVEALNTTTAKLVGGYWKLNGRIKLRFY